MNSLATRTVKKNATILQRIAEQDKIAVDDCIDTYGSLVWALAVKLTRSRQEAQAATEEIFTDIWQYCKSMPESRSTEEKLIARIALRRLIKFSRQAT